MVARRGWDVGPDEPGRSPAGRFSSMDAQPATEPTGIGIDTGGPD